MMGDDIGQPNRRFVNYYIGMFETLHLVCDINILEEFTNSEMMKTKHYLNTNDVIPYAPSVVEFILHKNIVGH